MPVHTFILPKLRARDQQICAVVDALEDLPMVEGFRVEVHQHKSTRSLAQNAYLWGVVYPTIAKHLQGWESDDIHDYCLGEHFGWEIMEGFGKKRMRPVRRSSKLSKFEFMEYIAFIQRRMAEHGIVIPDPDQNYRRDIEAADEEQQDKAA
jgi:hypothetical protein